MLRPWAYNTYAPGDIIDHDDINSLANSIRVLGYSLPPGTVSWNGNGNDIVALRNLTMTGDLDVGGDISLTNLSVSSAVDILGRPRVQGVVPYYELYETDAALNEKIVRLYNSGGIFQIALTADDGLSEGTAFTMSRSGTTPVATRLYGNVGIGGAPLVKLDVFGGADSAEFRWHGASASSYAFIQGSHADSQMRLGFWTGAAFGTVQINGLVHVTDGIASNLWQSCTYNGATSWTTFAGWAALSVRSLANRNRVEIRGTITASNPADRVSGAIVATLPAGFAPTIVQQIVSVNLDNGSTVEPHQALIAGDGSIVIYGLTASTTYAHIYGEYSID